MDSGQVKEIRNAVVKRCHSCGDAVHVYVDKRSTYVSYYSYHTCVHVQSV